MIDVYNRDRKNLISIIYKKRRRRRKMSKGSNYKLGQVFGYKGPNEKVQPEDIISSIKFNQNGNLLALGDNAGRIIIF